MKKTILFLLLLCALFPLLLLPVTAEGTDPLSVGEEIPEEYPSFLESIPKEVLELLPEELFSQKSQDVEDATRRMSSFSFLLKALFTAVGAELGGCLRLLASVCGLLILSSVFRTLRSSIGGEGIGRAFSFCSSLSILSVLIAKGYESIGRFTSSFSTLNAMTAALLPLLGVLYAMGGNLGTAVSATAGLSVYMTLMEELVGKSILPFCCICLAFALVGALDTGIRVGGLLSTVKKNYTTALAFLMMLLLAMLSAQTVLSAGSDSLAMRSAKFAAGNLIPVVGGSVSELLRTVSTGVGYLRSTLGICSILLLLLTLLPTLVQLLLTRLTWQLCASFADLLGCDGEKKLLDEFASLEGYLLAALTICSSVLVLSLTLLVRCATALG